MYDTHCSDLAEYFLKPDADAIVKATDSNIASLAQEIQDAIENWFTVKEQDAQEMDEGDAR